MQTMLVQRRNPDIRAYFVWAPFISTDTVASAQSVSERYYAPNSVYFWLPNTRIAQELAAVLRMGSGKLAWDVFLMYKRGVVWDATIPAPSYWQQQLEILQGAPFDAMVMEAQIQEALK